MTRRALLPAALAATAIAAAGCGSSSTSGGSFGDALSYMPKDAVVVIAIDTNPKSRQWAQASRLLSRFPFSKQIEQGIVKGISSQGVDYNSDVKPVLGNDAVVAIPTAAGLQSNGSTPFVAALKAKDAGKAKALVQQGSTKVGSVHGDDVYQSKGGGGFTALDGKVIVTAQTRTTLEQAIARHDGSSHMTVDDFNRLAGGLKQDSLVRVAGNLQAIVAGSPNSAAARRVKWVGALRTFAIALSAQPDGLAIDFNVKTAGGLSASDLPVAAGTKAPPVVRRPSEIGVGLRNLTQTVKFAEGVAQTTDPKGYARFKSQEAQAGRQLGIDIERDLVARASGNTSISFSTDGKYAVSAPQSDAAGTRALLAKVGPKLPKVRGSSIRSVTRGPGRLYVITDRKGTKTFLGMVGNNFVVASDAARAVQMGAESPSPVPGAKGAVTLALDTRGLVAAVAKQRGASGLPVQLLTGSLGDFTGWVESETSGLTGSFKLQIK